MTLTGNVMGKKSNGKIGRPAKVDMSPEEFSQRFIVGRGPILRALVVEEAKDFGLAKDRVLDLIRVAVGLGLIFSWEDSAPGQGRYGAKVFLDTVPKKEATAPTIEEGRPRTPAEFRASLRIEHNGKTVKFRPQPWQEADFAAMDQALWELIQAEEQAEDTPGE